MKRRLGNVLFLAWGIVMLAAGMAMALAGPQRNRAAAVGVALIGLAIAAVMAVQLMEPPRFAGLSLGRARIDDLDTTATVFERSRLRSGLMVLGSACLAMGGLILASEAGQLWLGLIIAMFFGSGVLVLGMEFARGGSPSLTVKGILWRGSPGAVWIPWSSIKRVSVVDFNQHSFLGLSLHSEGDVRIGRLTRMLARLSRSLVGADLSFSLQTVRSAPGHAAEIVRFYLEHSEHRSELDSSTSLERAHRITSALSMASVRAK